MGRYPGTPRLGFRLVNPPGYDLDFSVAEAIWDAQGNKPKETLLGEQCSGKAAVSLLDWPTGQRSEAAYPNSPETQGDDTTGRLPIRYFIRPICILPWLGSGIDPR